ncbi:MAG TPA: alpha/beta hydrolase [Bryobacteraceae bacterium]|nr:alpha/beta hydrolase [Bryobacteraceae bacterium]
MCFDKPAVILAGLAVMSWAAPPGGVAPDGTLHIKELSVPLSSFLSPEARAYMLHLLRDQPFAGGPTPVQDIQGYRARQDEILNGFLKPIRDHYPVNVEHQTIAGVDTDIVTPQSGVAPKNRARVLLNMHGGGFVSGARTAALIESIPIASTEKIKVVTIDYRMGPEYKFPAASEDVAAVYKEILKQYQPQHIGIYGCSAGGMLTAMSIAWFQKVHLPNPSAIGVLCASIGDMGGGDASYISGPLNGFTVPVGNPRAAGPSTSGPAYLSNVDPKDPLAYPINSPALVARFPPTLLVTSTRGMEFSSAINSHNALVQAGVEAELHVWDGLPHAFWYNSGLPESREVYRVIARFFDRHFGK